MKEGIDFHFNKIDSSITNKNFLLNLVEIGPIVW